MRLIWPGIHAIVMAAAIQNRSATKRIGETWSRLFFTTVKVLPQIKVIRIRARSACTGLDIFIAEIYYQMMCPRPIVRL